MTARRLRRSDALGLLRFGAWRFLDLEEHRRSDKADDRGQEQADLITPDTAAALDHPSGYRRECHRRKRQPDVPRGKVAPADFLGHKIGDER